MFGGAVFSFIVLYYVFFANTKQPLQIVFQITTILSIVLIILSFIMQFNYVVTFLALLAFILSTIAEIKYLQDDILKRGIRKEEIPEMVAYQHALIYRLFSSVIRFIIRF